MEIRNVGGSPASALEIVVTDPQSAGPRLLIDNLGEGDRLLEAVGGLVVGTYEIIVTFHEGDGRLWRATRRFLVEEDGGVSLAWTMDERSLSSVGRRRSGRRMQAWRDSEPKFGGPSAGDR